MSTTIRGGSRIIYGLVVADRGNRADAVKRAASACTATAARLTRIAARGATTIANSAAAFGRCSAPVATRGCSPDAIGGSSSWTAGGCRHVTCFTFPATVESSPAADNGASTTAGWGSGVGASAASCTSPTVVSVPAAVCGGAASQRSGASTFGGGASRPTSGTRAFTGATRPSDGGAPPPARCCAECTSWPSADTSCSCRRCVRRPLFSPLCPPLAIVPAAH